MEVVLHLDERKWKRIENRSEIRIFRNIIKEAKAKQKFVSSAKYYNYYCVPSILYIFAHYVHSLHFRSIYIFMH